MWVAVAKRLINRGLQELDSRMCVVCGVWCKSKMDFGAISQLAWVGVTGGGAIKSKPTKGHLSGRQPAPFPRWLVAAETLAGLMSLRDSCYTTAVLHITPSFALLGRVCCG